MQLVPTQANGPAARTINANIDLAVMRGLCTRNNLEVIGEF
jgi:hypothetical protein